MMRGIGSGIGRDSLSAYLGKSLVFVVFAHLAPVRFFCSGLMDHPYRYLFDDRGPLPGCCYSVVVIGQPWCWPPLAARWQLGCLATALC